MEKIFSLLNLAPKASSPQAIGIQETRETPYLYRGRFSSRENQTHWSVVLDNVDYPLCEEFWKPPSSMTRAGSSLA